jgi:hypothetical protein
MNPPISQSLVPVSPGQLYTDQDEKSGRYQVLKVLHADESVVVLRRYVNLFTERPTEIPEGLSLDMTPDAVQSGEIGISWDGLSIDTEGFAPKLEGFELLGEEPLTDEEREHVEATLHPPPVPQPTPPREGVISRLSRPFRRR